jgi:hypothetical protein
MSFPIETKRTFREYWPSEITALAIPARAVNLSLHDVAALGSFTPEFRAALANGPIRPDLSRAFLDELDATMAQAPGAVYPRLGYCSWKASSPCALPARTAQQILGTITRPDTRVVRALLAAVSARSALALHLVDWRDIAPWSEFRLFIRDRRLIGASQYYCDRAFPEILLAGSALHVVIPAFAEALGRVLHMTDVVADIYLSPDDRHGLRAELIELNPFSPLTSPCLFTWHRGGDFDGSIRIVSGGQKSSGLANLS